MAEPTEIPTHRMTVREFLAWADEQPSGRYELMDGQVVAMAPERVGHVRTKAAAWLALRNAVRAAGVPCTAYGDGLAVEVGEGAAYQPDALVNCGERLPDSVMMAPNPVIVVEVASPSTSRIDAIAKFRDYMATAAVRHYLILDPDKRIVIHHAKQPDGRIASAILGTGQLALDPPGITLRIEDLFED